MRIDEKATARGHSSPKPCLSFYIRGVCGIWQQRELKSNQKVSSAGSNIFQLIHQWFLNEKSKLSYIPSSKSLLAVHDQQKKSCCQVYQSVFKAEEIHTLTAGKHTPLRHTLFITPGDHTLHGMSTYSSYWYTPQKKMRWILKMSLKLRLPPPNVTNLNQLVISMCVTSTRRWANTSTHVTPSGRWVNTSHTSPLQGDESTPPRTSPLQGDESTPPRTSPLQGDGQHLHACHPFREMSKHLHARHPFREMNGHPQTSQLFRWSIL